MYEPPNNCPRREHLTRCPLGSGFVEVYVRGQVGRTKEKLKEEKLKIMLGRILFDNCLKNI